MKNGRVILMLNLLIAIMLVFNIINYRMVKKIQVIETQPITIEAPATTDSTNLEARVFELLDSIENKIDNLNNY